MPILCEIVTQERTVFSEEVDSVNLPGLDGRMGVLPNHMVMLTALGFGEIVIHRDGEDEYVAVGGGVAEILPDKVTILADSAELADEIDLQRAQAARQRAEEAMSGVVPEDPERFAAIEAELRRAQLRLDVARRRTGMGGRRSSALPTGRTDRPEGEAEER